MEEPQRLGWSIAPQSAVASKITVPFLANPDWHQWFLLTADRHLDNPHSNRELQKFHLDQAKERGAGVIDIGDFFDGMQGKHDKRSAKDDLMPRFKKNSYLNELVQDAYEFLLPYKDNIALLTDGNHETGVLKHTDYNLLDGLAAFLQKDGSPVVRGGYRGYVRFQFHHQAGGKKQSYLLYYSHGSGGGGPVTKGVIQTNRKSVFLSDADIVVSGHIHEQWKLNMMQSRLSQTGVEYLTKQHHVLIPTYKDEFTGLPGGFHHEGGRPPKPIGAWWLHFYFSKRQGKVVFSIVEAEE